LRKRPEWSDRTPTAASRLPGEPPRYRRRPGASQANRRQCRCRARHEASMSVAARVVSDAEPRLGHAGLARRTGLGVSFGRVTMSNHSVDLQNCHDHRGDRGTPGRAAPAGVRSGRRGARRSGAGARRRAAVARCDRQRRLDAGSRGDRRSHADPPEEPSARIVFVTVHCDPLLMERSFETGIRPEGGGGRGADERRPFGRALRTSHR
jgi:hypothetical protein